MQPRQTYVCKRAGAAFCGLLYLGRIAAVVQRAHFGEHALDFVAKIGTQRDRLAAFGFHVIEIRGRDRRTAKHFFKAYRLGAKLKSVRIYLLGLLPRLYSTGVGSHSPSRPASGTPPGSARNSTTSHLPTMPYRSERTGMARLTISPPRFSVNSGRQPCRAAGCRQPSGSCHPIAFRYMLAPTACGKMRNAVIRISAGRRHSLPA